MTTQKTHPSSSGSHSAALPTPENHNEVHSVETDFKTLPLQCKLSIGAVDDPLEHEADAMADKVMRMPEQNFIQRKCAHCEDEERVQRKPLVSFIQKKTSDNNYVAATYTISSQIASTKGSGNSMNEPTRSFMENRFGTDFSNVNIHTDNNATQLSNQLSAQAFTVGNDIYFNEGKYQPESSDGQRLLAHELTHVVQQTGSSSIINKQGITEALPLSPFIEAVVKEMHAAVEGWGTDEEGVYMALQKLKRNPEDIKKANDSYKKKYGKSLEKEIRDEMSGSEMNYALELINITGNDALIKKLPDTEEEYKSTAKRLANAMPHRIFGWGTDEETIFAILLPFDRSIEKLKALKLAYREVTNGRVIREDLRYEMSGSELSYALFLVNDPESETALELEGMVGKTMQWRQSIFLPCKDSVAVSGSGEQMKDVHDKTIRCTSFADWASSSKDKPPPALIDTTIINCWEVILLAAYNSGEISFEYIHDLYKNVPKCDVTPSMDHEADIKKCNNQQSATWVRELANDELSVYKPYHAGNSNPHKGDLTFFNKLEHVAMATGTGSNVFTFWPAPDVPFFANAAGAVKDKVKIVTIEALFDWWKTNNHTEPLIEFGHPDW